MFGGLNQSWLFLAPGRLELEGLLENVAQLDLSSSSSEGKGGPTRAPVEQEHRGASPDTGFRIPTP